MTLFLQLLIAHLLGDFVFQPKSWVDDKEQNKIRAKGLYYHIGTHILALMVMLNFDFSYWKGFLVIIVTHFIFDVFKIYVQNQKTQTFWFFVDQVLHFSILLLVTGMYVDVQIPVYHAFDSSVLLLIAAIIMVTWVCNVIILVILSRWIDFTSDSNAESLVRGGRFIGMIERTLIFIFITTGNWLLIGFLMLAKAIFSYEENRLTKVGRQSQYVLIGSLLSFFLAIAISLVYLHLKAYT